MTIAALGSSRFILAASLAMALTPTAQEQPGPETAEEGFPDLTPFEQCRMWPAFRMALELEEGEPWTPDSIKKCQHLATVMLEAWGQGREAAERLTGPHSPPEGVTFGPTPPIEKQGWLQTIPVAMHVLEPLWSLEKWDSDDLALALSAQEFFASYEGPPQVTFEEDQSDHNHEQLVVLGQWFRDQMKDPETYARMIFSTDDGPWKALEYRAEERLPSSSSMKVGESLELSLHVAEGPSAWVLQCFAEGELRWTKLITEVAVGMELEFVENRKPVKLGPYGWMVLMRFGVKYDMEAAILYLDPKGELLFYFVTT